MIGCEQAPAGVVVDQGGGRLLVDAQAVLDGLGAVVGALVQVALTDRLARGVAHVRGEHLVPGAPAGAADPAAGQPAYEFLARDLQREHRVQRRVELGERLVECLGLGERAREAVEQEVVLARGQALADHPDDDGVGHQIPGVHVALGLEAQPGALGHRVAQQVAGGQVGQAKVGLEPIGLGALAGTGGPEKDQAGYRRNPS